MVVTRVTRSRRPGPLAVVVVVAILARLIVIAPRVGRPADDPDNYLPIARSLAAGRGFSLSDRPTAYRPPLYPLILAPIVGETGTDFTLPIATLHLALGAGTVVLTAVAARRWGLSPRRVLVAASIVALDPVLVVQSRSVMTESLAAFLLAGGIAASARANLRGTASAGLWFGLAALCRPSTLPAACLAALFAAVTGEGSWRARILRGVLFAGVVAAVLAPWALRNARVFGEPVWTTTHGGYTLALANNSEYYRDVLHGAPGAVWTGPNQRAWFLKVSRETDSMTEPQADRYLRASALEMLRARPSDFARASLARLARFWGLAPSGSVYPLPLRIASALWTTPLWISVFLGLACPDVWKWPRGVAVAVIISLTCVHAVFWTDLRMRAPVVPSLALISASGWIWPRKKIREKSEKGPSCAVQNGEIG
ncbi:MAG: putative rane-bound dolichyl-phosphate-mannose-protein mannosyltransferase [Planctomycetota bacterium]|nr:putative rane-bound dolichyl-phosphate-mannose-protein mannosyltransferase [Planctomycetota bacterium]